MKGEWGEYMAHGRRLVFGPQGTALLCLSHALAPRRHQGVRDTWAQVTILHYMLGGLEWAVSSLWACSEPQMEELGRVNGRKTEVSLLCVFWGRAEGCAEQGC